jgi:hypothetical protein
LGSAQRAMGKSFLVLFFKKELLPCCFAPSKTCPMKAAGPIRFRAYLVLRGAKSHLFNDLGVVAWAISLHLLSTVSCEAAQ